MGVQFLNWQLGFRSDEKLRVFTNFRITLPMMVWCRILTDTTVQFVFATFDISDTTVDFFLVTMAELVEAC